MLLATEKDRTDMVTTSWDASKPRGEQAMGNPEPSAKASPSGRAMYAVQRVDVGR